MKVEVYAELCIRALGFNNNERIEERDALGLADIVRAKLLGDMLATGNQLTAEYYMKFHAKLETVKCKGFSFIYKPCDLLNLPRHGAYAYVGNGGIDNAYIPTTFPEIAAYARLEAGQMGGRTQFIPEGDKIFFDYLPVPAPDEIELYLVPSLLWLYDHRDDEDLIGTDYLMCDVFEKVLQLLQIRRATAVDNYNNDSPTPNR